MSRRCQAQYCKTPALPGRIYCAFDLEQARKAIAEARAAGEIPTAETSRVAGRAQPRRAKAVLDREEAKAVDALVGPAARRARGRCASCIERRHFGYCGTCAPHHPVTQESTVTEPSAPEPPPYAEVLGDPPPDVVVILPAAATPAVTVDSNPALEQLPRVPDQSSVDEALVEALDPRQLSDLAGEAICGKPEIALDGATGRVCVGAPHRAGKHRYRDPEEPAPLVLDQSSAARREAEPLDWDTGPAAPLDVVETRTPAQLAADGDLPTMPAKALTPEGPVPVEVPDPAGVPPVVGPRPVAPTHPSQLPPLTAAQRRVKRELLDQGYSEAHSERVARRSV